MWRKLLGIISVDFNAKGELLIIYSAVIKYLKKMGIKRRSVSSAYMQTSRKVMIQLGGRSCIIFSLSLVSHDTGKANKNVSD